MRVAQRRFNVGMIERPLYQLDVAGLAQKLGAEIMPVVVKSKSDDARLPAQVLPIGLHEFIGQRATLALHPASAGVPRDEGEDVLGMVTLQRPENFPDRRRD